MGEHAPEIGERKIDLKTGNRFELVESATGVAEATAADHGHDETTGGGNGRDHERSLVANTASGMFVYLPTG